MLHALLKATLWLLPTAAISFASLIVGRNDLNRNRGDPPRFQLTAEERDIELGCADYNAGRWEDAIRNFTQAIRLTSTNALAYTYRGASYLVISNLDGAISDLQRAIQLDPMDAFAHLNLACAYRAKGEFEKSVKGFSDYLKLNPTNDFAYKNRASVYNIQGEFNKALRDWNEGLRLNSKDPTALAMRGYAYFMKGQFAKALRDFREALRMDSLNEKALNNLAWLRATCPDAAMRNGAEAIEAGQKACELTGWSSWTRIDTLAAAFAEVGDFTQAAKHERQALGMKGPSKEELREMEGRLLLYEKRQPYRQKGVKKRVSH